MNDQKKQNWFARHKILTVVLALVVVGIVAVAASGDGDNTNQANNSETSEGSGDEQPTAATIGQPARDGKFEFTVKSVDCGKTSVGGEFYQETAQGQFCLLNVSIENIGDEPQSLLSDNQYLFNASGQKYSADDAATLANNPNNDSWYAEINPGNTVEGAIVFDIPKDQTPVSAELHDSAFSGGVKVNLQ